jgi:hypothetical protein
MILIGDLAAAEALPDANILSKLRRAKHGGKKERFEQGFETRKNRDTKICHGQRYSFLLKRNMVLHFLRHLIIPQHFPYCFYRKQLETENG